MFTVIIIVTITIISIYQKSEECFQRADWLVRKWIASTIHWAADESSLLDHFSVYLKK